MTDTITPVGRIVWGNPLIARQKTDNNGNPVMDKEGKPAMQWSFGLAIPKQNCTELFAAMQTEAATMYGQGVPGNFAWKFKDGDGMDDKDQPFSTREGYAGCFVFAISTEAFAPRVCRLVGGAYVDMTEGLKTGDYVRSGLNIKVHGPHPTARGSLPGLYINPTLIEFVGYGEEIRTGPDAMSLFGGQAAQLPPGASATPVAGGPLPIQPRGGGMLPGNPPMQPAAQPMSGAGMQTMPVAGAVPHQGNPAVPMQPGATAYPSNVQPAHDFVQNATGAVPTQPQQPAVGVPGGAPLPGFPGQN